MIKFVIIILMIGLFVILGIVLGIIYVAMMSMMIIFERDKPKNIIIWSFVFLVTQIVGYIIYIAIRQVFYKKRQMLETKQKEDEIYQGLIANHIIDNKANINEDIFQFNELAFNAKTTKNNHFEIFTSYQEVKSNLIDDIMSAKHYIILELNKINAEDFSEIKDAIIEKSKANINIKFVYDRFIKFSFIKELKQAGVKVYRFSKYNTVGKVYSNLRNIITIDGEACYIANFNVSKKQIKSTNEIACSFIKLKGDIVQEIDVLAHKDTIFASGKYIDYKKCKEQGFSNNNIAQFVSNQVNTDMELSLIKAICMAKKSVQLQLVQFIPTESIMSLLRFAINSNIEVRLMVPLKNDRHGKYFATRAYAKELALFGANVYLFDGYIKFNAITIDDDYVIYGSFIVDREHLNTSPQSMLYIKDNSIVKHFNNHFNKCIDNSYRINNAKFMLMREKFFKNFV